MLPGQSGFDFACALRAEPAHRNIPIIMLTARGQETDRVTALKAGADDYVSKPFSISELIARIGAVLRRTGQQGSGKHPGDGQPAPGPGKSARQHRWRAPGTGANGVPAAVISHGPPRTRLYPAAINRPDMEPWYICGRAHRRCPYTPVKENHSSQAVLTA